MVLRWKSLCLSARPSVLYPATQLWWGIMVSHFILCVRPSVLHQTIRLYIFRFRMITCKYEWIFSKLGMCIDIVEIQFGIANGQISSDFYSYLPKTRPYFYFRMITWENISVFPPNLICALILWKSGLGLLMGKFLQILTELSAWDKPIFSFSRR